MNGNLFRDIPNDRDAESFQTLWSTDSLKIERILSFGQATPPGEWYDQPQDEWVVLLIGGAGLLIEGREIIELQPGDYVLLPAHCRHRVEWTKNETIWLAVHLFPHTSEDGSK